MAYSTRNNMSEQQRNNANQQTATAQFADNRSSAATQLKQHALMAASPNATAQRAAINTMNSSVVQQQKIIQRMEPEEELQLKAISQTAQFADMDEEELLQGKFETAQRAEDEELLQGKFEPAQRAEKPNNTGLPDNLKSGIENLSGMSMDHVKVHYNSEKPAQLQAHAYAQGSEIHVGPGQEKHLPHEAWHVVQQAQGRVRPTVQMKGDVQVNDDVGLEREADLMGGAISRESGLDENIYESSSNSLQQLTPARPTAFSFCIGTASLPDIQTGCHAIQRKLDFKHDGTLISNCVFTKRPGWTSEVKKNMPTVSGHDRGHLIPWMAVRLEIEADMVGMNKNQAYDYLESKGHPPAGNNWQEIEKSIKDYGRAENSDLDNLEYEDSSDNRSNGAKLPAAAELWQCAHEINDWEWDPPYTFNGKEINKKKEAIDACLKVGVPDESLWPAARKRFGAGSNCSIM